MRASRKDLPRLFSQTVGRSLDTAVPLSGFSHFRIGGEADYFFAAANQEDFLEAIRFAREYSIPYYVIGGGYNLLFDDEGFRGLIICNRVQGNRKKGDTEVETDSGTKLGELIQFCQSHGLGGLEFLAGIPGTVGGAVFGNAGAFEQEIGSFLMEAHVLLQSGDEIRVGRDFFEFGYRQSRLKDKHEILLRATFACRPGKKEISESLVRENLKKREDKLPHESVACAGSYFKNPVDESGSKVPAAHLLDQVGAKQLRVGEAAVFFGHANFIINQGKASSREVRALASLLKQKVKDEFGIELEEEVIFLPADFPAL
jgi:UDP-N-acetylmuramate dehydrogenase